ncbi:MAG: ABC transporter permease [Oscillospiraceae bacterium]|nr:ABC transporter permease [Oscillospiraceae bacterium]
MKQRKYTKLLREYSLILFVILLILVCGVVNSSFLTGSNLENVLRTTSNLAIISMGMLLVVVTGGIDLGVAANAGFAGVFLAGSLLDGMPAGAAVAVTLLICTVVGTMAGFMVNYMNIAPFIATLACSSIMEGFKYIYCNSNTITITNQAFLFFGNGETLGISNCIVYMIIIVAVLQFVMAKTTYGRSLYAIGGNPAAAHLAGINIKRLTFSAYMLSGFLAGWSGIIMAARLGVGSPTTGLTYVNYAIASTVIGGATLAGGRGKPVVVMFGALVIAIINNFMTLQGIGSYYQKVVLGVIIIVAVFFSETTNKKR